PSPWTPAAAISAIATTAGNTRPIRISPPCTPTRNLNATAALRFQVRSARQDGTAGRSILSDWQINGRARGERATLPIPSLTRFRIRRPAFLLKNIWKNGQTSRNDVLSLGH